MHGTFMFISESSALGRSSESERPWLNGQKFDIQIIHHRPGKLECDFVKSPAPTQHTYPVCLQNILHVAE